MLGDFNLVDVILGCVGLYTLKRLYYSSTSSAEERPPLPPGPEPKPIIGNLLDMPPAGELEWQHWAKHKDLYGPISCLSIMGQHIVILNDLQVAYELLEKRTSISSDRPSSVFGGIMCGWEKSLAMTSYGERFRRIRRGLHQAIGSGAALRKYHALEEREVKRLMLRLLDDPDNLEDHIRRTVGAVLLSISHGYAIEQDGIDPLVALADECLAEASVAFQPGSWAVDLIPALRFLPDWFPGTGFKRVAETMFAHARELVERPHAFVKQQMAMGTARPSVTQEMLEDAQAKGDLSADDEAATKWAAAAIYGGGADPTAAAAHGFVLAMLLYPDVQRRAQAELDRVVGAHRLPTCADRGQLPYVSALVTEALRWPGSLLSLSRSSVRPIGMGGAPHVVAAAEDDNEILHGYLIPRGAIVLPNVALFARDPDTYHDPLAFRPERFLASEREREGHTPELDPRNFVFGFGRRACPGRALAELSLFTLLATTLAVFDIRAPTDARGQPTTQPEASAWTPGLVSVSRPKGFRAAITPRSEKAAALVRASAKAAEYDRAATATATGTAEKSDAEALLGVSVSWEDAKSNSRSRSRLR